MNDYKPWCQNWCHEKYHSLLQSKVVTSCIMSQKCFYWWNLEIYPPNMHVPKRVETCELIYIMKNYKFQFLKVKVGYTLYMKDSLVVESLWYL